MESEIYRAYLIPKREDYQQKLPSIHSGLFGFDFSEELYVFVGERGRLQ